MAPSYTLDLSGYKPSISDKVDDGRYLAIVDDYTFGKSKAQNDMFTVYLRIASGPYQGSVIIDRLSVTDKALFKIVGFLNGLGIPTPKKRLSINPEQWLRRKVYIDVSQAEPYQGRPGTSQVEGYSRYIADEAEPPETVEAVTAWRDEPEAAEVKFDEANSIENDMAEPGVITVHVEETPAEDDAPATASPAKAEPETLSLSDISL